MTTTLAKKRATYYCCTYIYQGDNEFRCTWDFRGTPDKASATNHLAGILNEYQDAFEDGNAADFNFYGMHPEDFAAYIVESEKASKERLGTSWVISTRFEEVDTENWEHPCNL